MSTQQNNSEKKPSKESKDLHESSKFLEELKKTGDLVVGQRLHLGKKLERRAARESLSFFTEEYLGFKNNWHHREWYDIVQGRKIQDKGKIDEDFSNASLIPNDIGRVNRQILIEAPRDHAKSTCFSVNTPLWFILKDPNIRIIIVSATSAGAIQFLREIKTHIERNEKLKSLKDLMPRFPERWTDKDIIVDRTDLKLKDPTVCAVGTGGTILTRRTDVIIADDILNKENTRTPEQRAKVREWLFEVLFPVLVKGGLIVAIGTVFCEEDLYNYILQDPSWDIRLRYKAILNDEKKEVMWSDRWSYEALMKRKASMGSIAFARQYQNEIVAPEACPFKIEWVREAKKKGEKLKLLDKLDWPTWTLGPMRISAGMDLAISITEEANYTVLLTLGVLKDGTRVLLNIIRDKMSPAEQRQTIIDQYKKFKQEIILVENNAYQAALEKDMIEATAIPIRGFTTSGEKFDEEVGINSLAVLFENGKFILPYDRNDSRTVDMVDVLTSEMFKYPSGHTGDVLMALWFANTALRQLETGGAGGDVVMKFDKKDFFKR